MPRPAMRLRILPRFPAQVQATAPIAVTKTAGTYLFTADYRPVGEEAAPALGAYALVLQNQTTGAFVRTLLADLPTGSTDWANIQNRPTKIDSLATLDTSPGAVEQTGTNTFAKRTIGGGGATSLVTYGDGSLFYQPMSPRLSSIASTGVQTADIVNDAVTFAKVQNFASAGLFGASTAGGGGLVTIGAGLTLSGGQLSSSGVAATGSIVNSAYGEYTTNAALAATIPIDDTIPQVGEGTQILSVVITPTSTANKLRARFRGTLYPASVAFIIPAMFVNGAANAVAASAAYGTTASGGYDVTLEYEFVPGSTSAQTFTIRVGASAGSIALNGQTLLRYLGGAQRATLVIEEIKA